MASNHGPTYCCQIGNIPDIPDKQLIVEYFKKEAKKCGDLHSVKVTYNDDRKLNQCYLNFFDENFMRNAIHYFDGKNYCGKI